MNLKKAIEAIDDWTNLQKWGLLGAIVFICVALIYLVRENNSNQNSTANNVLVAWTKCAQELPAIAAQIRDDSRMNAAFMRDFSDKAHEERLAIREELSALRKAVTELVEVLKTAEQRKNPVASPTSTGDKS